MGGRTGNGEGGLIRNDTVCGASAATPPAAALEGRECKGGGDNQDESDQDELFHFYLRVFQKNTIRYGLIMRYPVSRAYP